MIRCSPAACPACRRRGGSCSPAGSGRRLVASARQVPLWIVTAEGAPHDRADALTARGVELLRVTERNGTRDLAAVLKLLAGRGITRLMVEAGPILATAFLKADLVDEAVLFRSPITIGPDRIDALDGVPLSE